MGLSCCFILSTSTTACAPGPGISGKANRGSENEQLFRTWSDSLSNAEEHVNALFCSRGRPFILIPQFLWVSVHWLCEQSARVLQHLLF